MIERNILSGLLHDEEYTRKVLPFLKSEYFSNTDEQVVFEEIVSFVDKYNSNPTKETLQVEIESRSDLNESRYANINNIVNQLTFDKLTNQQWLVDKTEEFCQEKSLYNAIRKSIQIMDGSAADDKGMIPKLLSDALGVSFDTNVGHDYTTDIESRYEEYHRVEERIPFDLELFNYITKGGIPKKTINILMASTGVGKTMAMCHMAAANLMHGKSVLYITMEMSQIRIAERIDANLLDVTLDDLKMIGLEKYKQRSERLLQKTNGKLIIKEFPTASAHSGHFRHLLNELRLKKNFVPDIVYIDYLNICASYRMKMGNSVNSYSYIKAIAEELRGLAVEFDIAIVSATQTNREGFNNSDIDLTNTSESIGLPATADFMVALIKTDELESMGQIMVKQLKNRYGDLNKPARFVVGVDREKMRLFDLDESAQANVAGGYVPGPANYAKPVMDKAGDYSEFETVDTNSFKPKTNNKRVSF